MNVVSTYIMTGLLIAAGSYVIHIGDNFWWILFGIWIITLGVALFSVNTREHHLLSDPREIVMGYSSGLVCIIAGIFVIKGGYEVSLDSGWVALLIASIVGIGGILFGLVVFIGPSHMGHKSAEPSSLMDSGFRGEYSPHVS